MAYTMLTLIKLVSVMCTSAKAIPTNDIYYHCYVKPVYI